MSFHLSFLFYATRSHSTGSQIHLTIRPNVGEVEWTEKSRSPPIRLQTYLRSCLLKYGVGCFWRREGDLLYSSPRAHLHVVGMLWFMPDINQPSLPTPFYSVLVSISVLMALSTLFLSINSPDNSPFSHSVLPILPQSYWSVQLYFSLWKFPSTLT